MSSIEQYINLGIAGVALYLMYNLSVKTLEKIQLSIDSNTKAIMELRLVVEKLCNMVNGTNGSATN